MLEILLAAGYNPEDVPLWLYNQPIGQGDVVKEITDDSEGA